MNIEYIEALIERHEGHLRLPYRDTDGNLTVGVGFNLMKPGAKGSCESAGIDYAAVCAGAPLTDAQIDTLFHDDVYAAIFGARLQVPNFDTLPNAAQAVVVDMVFNLGALGFSRFVELRNALSREDFSEAAAQIKDSRWCGQVGMRCEDDARLMGCVKNPDPAVA